jgi:hypothetical protein
MSYRYGQIIHSTCTSHIQIYIHNSNRQKLRKTNNNYFRFFGGWGWYNTSCTSKHSVPDEMPNLSPMRLLLRSFSQFFKDNPNFIICVIK